MSYLSNLIWELIYTENLTRDQLEDQIGTLEYEADKPSKIILIFCVILFFLLIYIYVHTIRLWLSFRVLDVSFRLFSSRENILLTHVLLTNIVPTILIFLLTIKIYYFTIHFYISSQVKELQIKNLEAKVTELDNQLNPPIPEKLISPKLQKEIDKIRAFGKKK